MISEQLYAQYLNDLLQGNRAACTRIVNGLMGSGIEIRDLYADLFRRSLYEVGELWETNRITVAKEHLATAVTEGLLNLVYPRLFKHERPAQNKKAVVSCAANEFHQVGGKMIADIFEMHGWDGYFLGANTPVDEMLAYVHEVNPDLVGLSLSIYFNMPSLQRSIEALRSNFNSLDILVGGQAFRWGGRQVLKHYPGTHYIRSMNELIADIGA